MRDVWERFLEYPLWGKVLAVIVVLVFGGMALVALILDIAERMST